MRKAVILIMIVQGACAWWAAAVRGIEPIILSFGAAFAAIGLNNEQPNHNVLLSKAREFFDKEQSFQDYDEEEKRLYKKAADDYIKEWQRLICTKDYAEKQLE